MIVVIVVLVGICCVLGHKVMSQKEDLSNKDEHIRSLELGMRTVINKQLNIKDD